MLKKLKTVAKRIKREVKIYQLVIKDRETPKIAKVFLGFAIAYTVCPIDIIPDFIPVIGYLDDILILALLFSIAFRFIPPHIIEKHRKELEK